MPQSLFLKLIIFSSYMMRLDALNWTISESALPDIATAQLMGINSIGNIYLFGGQSQDAGLLDVIWKWNGFPSSSFHKIGNITNNGISAFESLGQSTVSINDLVYFIGVADGSIDGNMYIYNMTTETFIESNNIQKMPEPSVAGCVATDDEFIFYVGGFKGNYKYSNKIQIFDISLKKWIRNVTLPNNRRLMYSSCIVINDFLYSFGGSFGNNIFSDIYKLDISNMSSSVINLTTTTLSKPRKYSKAIIGPDELVYIIGGSDDKTSIDIFDPLNEIIITDTNHLKDDIISPNVAIAGNSNIMVFGGSSTAIQISNEINIVNEISFSFNEIYPGSKLTFTIDDFYDDEQDVVEILLYSDSLYIKEKIRISLYENDTYECVLISNNKKCADGIYVGDNIIMLGIDENEYILNMHTSNVHVPPQISLHRKIQSINLLIDKIHFGGNVMVNYQINNNDSIFQSSSLIEIKAPEMGLNAFINIDYNIYDNYTNSFECKICDIATKQCDSCSNGIFVSMNSKLINTQQTIHLNSSDSYLSETSINVSILPCRIGTTCVGSKCVECPYNEYNIRSGDNCTECNINNKGYECLGGSNIIVTYNYWINVRNFSNHSDKIFDDSDIDTTIISVLCPSGYCCTHLPHCNFTQMRIMSNNDDRIDTLCALNRDPDSILCGKCKEGYAEVFGSDQCGKCENNYWLLLLPLFISLPYVFALGYSSFNMVKRTKNTNINDDVADIVMVNDDNDSTFTGSNVEEKKNKQDILRKLIKTDAKVLKLIVFRPLTIFFQSLFIICSQYGLQWYLMPFVRLFMLDVLLVPNDDGSGVQNGVCLSSNLNAISEQLWYLFFPICIFIWLLILKLLTTKSDGNVNLYFFKIGLKFDNAFWNTVLISIGIVASKIFMFVSCQKIGALNVHFYFGNYQCYKTIWISSLIVILLMIISFIYMWYKLYKMDIKQRESSKQFLYFIIKPYKQNLWFYEFVIIARRIFLTFTVTFPVSLRNVFIAVVLTCSFFAQIKYSPFKSGRVNQFETMGIFLALIALFFVGFVGEQYDEMLSAALFSITFIPIIIFLYHLIKFIKRTIEVCRNQNEINQGQQKRVIRMLDKLSLSTRHRYTSKISSNAGDNKNSLISFDYALLQNSQE